MARKDDVVKNEETTNLPAKLEEAAKAVALANEEANKAPEQEEPKNDAPKKASSRSRKVNLDKKLAGKGTFAVGAQAMMRNRINKRG